MASVGLHLYLGTRNIHNQSIAISDRYYQVVALYQKIIYFEIIYFESNGRLAIVLVDQYNHNNHFNCGKGGQNGQESPKWGPTSINRTIKD